MCCNKDPHQPKKLSKNKKAKATKAKNKQTHRWDYIKIKSFAEQGKPSRNWKSNQMNKRKYLQIMYLIKVCLSACVLSRVQLFVILWTVESARLLCP